MNGNEWFRVTLREWVETQRSQHTPHRARLLAAIDDANIPVIRDIMEEAPFDGSQRRYMEDVLQRWERATADVER